MVRTAGVIVFDGDKVLLVRHEEESRQVPTGCYSFPAGKVEDGEGEAETAARELMEETGVEVRISDLVRLSGDRGAWLDFKTGRDYCTFALFLAKKTKGVVSKKEDKVTPVWISMDKVADLKTMIDIESAIKEALELQKTST